MGYKVVWYMIKSTKRPFPVDFITYCTTSYPSEGFKMVIHVFIENGYMDMHAYTVSGIVLPTPD